MNNKITIEERLDFSARIIRNSYTGMQNNLEALDFLGIKRSINLYNHVNKMQPVLNEITNKKAILTNNVERASRLAKSDLRNLAVRPYTELRRESYLEETVPNFNNLENLNEYRRTLRSLEENSNLENLETFEDFVFDTEARSEATLYARNFFESLNFRPDQISLHRSYSEYCDFLKDILDDLSIYQLNLLKSFVEQNELFALITFEPMLICALGNTLFYELFIPLHYEGCFTYLMHDAIEKQITFRNYNSRLTFNNIMNRFRTFYSQSNSRFLYCYNKYNTIKALVLSKSNELVSYVPTSFQTIIISYVANKSYNFIYKFFVNNLIKELPENKSVTIVSDFVKSTILGGEGQKHPVVEKVLEEVTKTSYTLGDYMGSTIKSFFQGFFHSHENTITKGAEELDKYLSKK